ncbi:sensor domain-containing protein [Aerophototrophica crusticola]|uniref:Sensor domain-containing protein n=1 Tax=Aerophototrophica crusticola TaxID=1709002 RepID=A0A858R5X0_9PROT|nr:sensor domain-containing protein [Rhodospirillaceae bacterium B3]
MRVAFFYNAQLHQIPHSLPMAFELSAMQGFCVDILSPYPGHLDFVREMERLYPESRVNYRLLGTAWPLRLLRKVSRVQVPPKLLTLWHNRHVFDEYDALVVTEKTSLNLKRFGVRRPKFIHTAHGAGDKGTAVERRIRKFDFVLAPGPKTAGWLAEAGLVRPGDHAVGAYAKFDMVRRMRQQPRRLFDNDRPTILYNPNWDPKYASWERFGWDVLEYFAGSDRYNLVFAPHVRLFDPPTPDKYAPFARYRDLPHMLIDLGSGRSVDMTYTISADAYLGDVSSQVYEFLLSPRPCLFLDAHGVEWQGNPRYLFWTLGPVVSDMADFGAALDSLMADPSPWRPFQEQAVAATFDLTVAEPGRHNADVIATWLRKKVAAGKA